MKHIIPIFQVENHWSEDINNGIIKGHNLTRLGVIADVVYTRGNIHDYYEDVVNYVNKLDPEEDTVVYLTTEVAVHCLLHAQEIEYEVLIHTSLDYRNYNIYANDMLFKVNQIFNNRLYGNNNAARTYGDEYGRIIGGFINKFSKPAKIKNTAYCVTKRTEDPIDDFKRLLLIVEANPDIKFYLLTEDEITDVPKNLIVQKHLDKDDYTELVNSCEFVVSTKRRETMGYALMNAVAASCIPVVPDYPCYEDYYPERFRYSGLPKLSNYRKFKNVELRNIVRDHEISKTYKRLINYGTL